MKSKITLNPNKLHIYHEGKKRRLFVAELKFNTKKSVYELTYDEKYINSKTAIPLSPQLDLFTQHHVSKKNKIFPIFLDRIPDKQNSAYKDYCDAKGISVDEDNLIILLGTIGSRGPSTFIYEQVYDNNFAPETVKLLREDLDISQHDFALAFDISLITLQRIEAGTSCCQNTLNRIQLYFEVPEAALWQLKLTGGTLHYKVLSKLVNYFSLI